MLIGGSWVEARSGARFESVNPFLGRPWATVPRAGAEDVDAAVGAARDAFAEWSRTTPVTRGKLLRRLADLIAAHASEIARVETTDNGKLIREMEGQLRGLADYYHYFAGAADCRDGPAFAPVRAPPGSASPAAVAPRCAARRRSPVAIGKAHTQVKLAR